MGDSSVATSGTKKKKGFFKSLGKGRSIRKKKNRPDDASVTSIALDRNGAVSSSSFTSAAGSAAYQSGGGGSSSASGGLGGGSSSSAPAAKPIQVVLLLMDPSSRRFELLQLEFDSTKAMVSDVLRQIQASATETTLRDMTYAGVCDQTGMEMISSMKLSKFCKGNDVVMAMPKGMNGKDTAKLAGPILGDPKVEDMLAPCGVKVQPIARKSRSSANSKLTKIAEEDIRRKEDKKKRPPSPKKAAKGAGGAGKSSQKKKSSSLPTVILGLIISSLVFFTAQRHMRVTSPLESGDVLMPGEWKSQCGIFDLVPPEWLEKLPLSSPCDLSVSPMLEYGKDGTLRYFTKDGADGERKEIWSLAGSGVGQCSEGEEEECFDKGATFVKDGSSWYVDMSGTRSTLNKDVVRDFTTES